MIYTVGHPNASIKEAATACDTQLVSLAGETVDALIEMNPFYATASIPAGMYRGTDQTTHTFGVKATLVTSADTDADVVYQLVKVVFENLDSFRKLHPAFTNLQTQAMLQGNSAPFHAGAQRYFREAGLVKE
jgi:TRAP transporter TAXI family solute receptor